MGTSSTVDISVTPFAGVLSFAAPQKRTMIASVLLSVISVLAGLVPYAAVAILLVSVIEGRATVSQVLVLAGVATIAYVVKVACYGQATLLSHRATYRILADIRGSLSSKLARASMGEVTSKPAGVHKRLIVDEVEKLEYPLAHAIPELTANALAPIVVSAYLFFIDWRLALAALAALPVGFGVYALMMIGRGKMYDDYVAANTEMNGRVVEYINGIEVIKTFNQTASSMRSFADSVTHFRDMTLQWYRHCWPYLSAFAVLLPASIALVLPLAAGLFASGSVSLITLVSAVLLCLGLAGPVMKLVEFSENVAVILETERSVIAALNMPELPDARSPAAPDGSTIVVDDVTFGYGETDVLHSVSFTAHAGATTALVGPSGSGKSTLAKLIARFWDVDEGSIRLGGTDVREIPLAQLAGLVSYVAQDNFLFDLTIAENIRMGRPGASDEEVEEAAVKSGCGDFIARFPDGLNTRVGDAGDRLSGGERQRVAIARALIKDAPVIVLDEATAFTDPENEHIIQSSLSRLVHGKTLVIIAHRLTTVMHADSIVAMDEGRISAQGTHAELLENSALYRRLWEANERGAYGVQATLKEAQR